MGRIFTIQDSDMESDPRVWLRWNRHKVNRTGAKSKLREKSLPQIKGNIKKNYEYKNEWWEWISYCLELHLESNYIGASSSTSILQFFSGRVILFSGIYECTMLWKNTLTVEKFSLRAYLRTPFFKSYKMKEKWQTNCLEWWRVKAFVRLPILETYSMAGDAKVCFSMWIIAVPFL